MATIGSLTVNLSLQSAAFIRDLGKSSQAVARNTNLMQRSLGTLTAGFAGLFSARLIKQIVSVTTESLKLAAAMHGPLADAAKKSLTQFEELQHTFQLGLAKGFLDATNQGLVDTKGNLEKAAAAGENFGGVLGAVAKDAGQFFGTDLPEFIAQVTQAWKEFTDGVHLFRQDMQELSFEGMQAGLGIKKEDTEVVLAYGTAAEMAAMAQQSFWSATVEATAHGEELLRVNEAQLALLQETAGPMEQYERQLRRIAEAQLTGTDAARAHSAATAQLVGNYLELADNIGTALGIMFKESKGVAVAQAVINTAQAITKTFAEYGATPWGFALAASMAAVGAAQIATILSSQPGTSKKPTTAAAKGRGGGATGGGQSTPRQAVTIQLMGQGGFTRDQVRQLAEQLNGLVSDGAVIRTA